MRVRTNEQKALSFIYYFQEVSLKDRRIPFFLPSCCEMEQHGLARAPAAMLDNKVAALCLEQQEEGGGRDPGFCSSWMAYL